MNEVNKTAGVIGPQDIGSGNMDCDQLSFLIGCAKIRELEQRLEEYFADVEQRLSAIKTLQKFKQKVVQGGDSLDASKDPEFADLLQKATALGLSWTKNGWSTKEERDTLIDALHVQITGRESENQTVFMRINRLMNLRSEAANLFSKIVSDTQNQKLRILGRIEKR